jgi:hypothetical protein
MISDAADVLCQKGLLSVVPNDGGERRRRHEAARENSVPGL